jgi:hypothetical protein
MFLPGLLTRVMYTRSDGKTVCFDHRLRRCDKCCMDFSCGELEEDEVDKHSYFLDEHLPEENEGDDRVFLLAGSTARFMTQWDDQILGAANAGRIGKGLDNPPNHCHFQAFKHTTARLASSHGSMERLVVEQVSETTYLITVPPMHALARDDL